MTPAELIAKTTPEDIRTLLETLERLIRVAENLDDYCMGGTNQRHTLNDIRHVSNEAANAGREVLARWSEICPPTKEEA